MFHLFDRFLVPPPMCLWVVVAPVQRVLPEVAHLLSYGWSPVSCSVWGSFSTDVVLDFRAAFGGFGAMSSHFKLRSISPLICGGRQVCAAPAAGNLNNCSFQKVVTGRKAWLWSRADRGSNHVLSLGNQVPSSLFTTLAELISLVEEWKSVSPAL